MGINSVALQQFAQFTQFANRIGDDNAVANSTVNYSNLDVQGIGRNANDRPYAFSRSADSKKSNNDNIVATQTRKSVGGIKDGNDIKNDNNVEVPKADANGSRKVNNVVPVKITKLTNVKVIKVHNMKPKTNKIEE